MAGILTFLLGEIPMTIIRIFLYSTSKVVNILGIILTSILVMVCYYMAISGAALMKLEGTLFIYIY